METVLDHSVKLKLSTELLTSSEVELMETLGVWVVRSRSPPSDFLGSWINGNIGYWKNILRGKRVLLTSSEVELMETIDDRNRIGFI